MTEEEKAFGLDNRPYGIYVTANTGSEELSAFIPELTYIGN